jgi:acylphosphatase
MADDTIDIVIHADGRVEIQVCGVKGERCLEVTKAVEEALGGKVERQVTSEMYETEEETTSQTDIQKLGG